MDRPTGSPSTLRRFSSGMDRCGVSWPGSARSPSRTGPDGWLETSILDGKTNRQKQPLSPMNRSLLRQAVLMAAGVLFFAAARSAGAQVVTTGIVVGADPGKGILSVRSDQTN